MSAPLTTYKRVYAIPMTSISMEKGTGIYETIGEKVMQMTGKTNPNSAVKMIVNSGAQLPI